MDCHFYSIFIGCALGWIAATLCTLNILWG